MVTYIFSVASRAAALTAARDQVVMKRRTANTDRATDKHYLVKPDAYEAGRRGLTNSPNPNSPNPNSRSNSRDQRTDAPGLSSRTRNVPPFIAAHDVPRGILFALQMLIMYTLMLAIMYVGLVSLYALSDQRLLGHFKLHILSLSFWDSAWGRCALGGWLVLQAIKRSKVLPYIFYDILEWIYNLCLAMLCRFTLIY